MSNFIVRPGVDVVKMLKAAGYSTYTIAKAKERTGDYILGQSTLTKLRRGGLPSWGELSKLVHLLNVSPCDLIAYQTDNGNVYDLTGKQLLDGQQNAQATQPQPHATTAPDNLLQVPLSPDMIHNMDGAIRCGYSSDRVQYAIRAINTQIQQDIAAEKEKRRSCVQPAMSYTYDPYYDDAPPDDY